MSELYNESFDDLISQLKIHTIVCSLENVVIYIDPYLSDRQSRVVPIPIQPIDVKADIFLFTHHHDDHLDKYSLSDIYKSNPNALYIGPVTCCNKLDELKVSKNNIIPVNRWETKIIDNIELTTTYAEHTYDSVGYIIKIGKYKIYHTGDSLFHSEFKKLSNYNPDVLISSIN